MAVKILKKLFQKSDIKLLISSICLLCILLLSWQNAHTQSVLNGVYKNYTGIETTGDNELVAARNRLRLSLRQDTDFGGFTAKTDLLNSFEDPQDIELLLREAYLDWYLDSYDIRIGKQVIAWGRTNGAFVTDILSPLDVREFLTIPIEDIRLGLTSLNVIRYFGSDFLQFVFAPFEQPDLLPAADSRWFPINSEQIPFDVETEQSRLEETENRLQGALRFAWRSPDRLDLDLMAMRWAHPVPAYDIGLQAVGFPDLVQLQFIESYRSSWMGGASVSWNPVSSLFIKAEGLLVESKLFNNLPISAEIPEGDNPSLRSLRAFLQSVELDSDFDGLITERPWIHAMAGIEFEVWDTNISLEGYIEQILDYKETILQEEQFEYATLSATRSFLENRLNILALSRYQFDRDDYWVQVRGTYEIRNGFEATLGTNLFSGPTPPLLYGHLSFGNYSDSSFIFSKIALFF